MSSEIHNTVIWTLVFISPEVLNYKTAKTCDLYFYFSSFDFQPAVLLGSFLLCLFPWSWMVQTEQEQTSCQWTPHPPLSSVSSYRSCQPSPHRKKRCRCGTSSAETSPRPSQRCTGPVGCRWCWSCWSGCRTTASPSPAALCRRVWAPSWSPRTSSWWSLLIRQKQTPQSWGWVPEKPAVHALASWSRPGQMRWNEKATNPGFWYAATVFRLPADISNLHNLVVFGAPWVRRTIVYIPPPPLPPPLMMSRDFKGFILYFPTETIETHGRPVTLSGSSNPGRSSPFYKSCKCCDIIHYKWQMICQPFF